MGLFSKKYDISKAPVYRAKDITVTNVDELPSYEDAAAIATEAPAYEAVASNQPSLVEAFSNLRFSATSLPPSGNQCIAHLKLLEAIYRLRIQVGERDNLFNIPNSAIPAVPEKCEDPELLREERAQGLFKLAERRWATYVARAVDRFGKWWDSIPSDGVPKIEDMDIDKNFPERIETGGLQNWQGITADTLPPLDVLMVWHTFMLNPRCYLDDCLRTGRMHLWRHYLPWEAINNAIDNYTFAYTPNPNAINHWEESTGEDWQEDPGAPPQKVITCPSCRATLEVPYTTVGRELERLIGEKKVDEAQLDSVLEKGFGYTDKGFFRNCDQCSQAIVHDTLRVYKFKMDLAALKTQNIPMPGTILNVQGVAKGAYEPEGLARCHNLYPNYLFLHEEILGPLEEKLAFGPETGAEPPTMADLKEIIDKGVTNHKLSREIMKNHPRTPSLSSESRVMIRKTMSKYWENDSPFAIELVGAVLRQGSFIEKMHKIDWLHSPSLTAIISRCLLRYDRFWTLMARVTGSRMCVPTLDIDLAWHTHQLCPKAYYRHSLDKTKQHTFIDHDDKVAETPLADSFSFTCKIYQEQYKEPYSECTCWFCAGIRENHANTGSRLLNKFSSVNSAELERKIPPTTDLDKCNHISAHPAIYPELTKKQQTNSRQRLEDFCNENYRKALKRAEKRGLPIPSPPPNFKPQNPKERAVVEQSQNRKDTKYTDPYSYGPYYNPWFGLPFYPAPGFYYGASYGAATAACGNFEAGGMGNCVAGTCRGPSTVAEHDNPAAGCASGCGGMADAATCASQGYGMTVGGFAAGGGCAGGCGAC